jgi:hypothetical protein
MKKKINRFGPAERRNICTEIETYERISKVLQKMSAFSADHVQMGVFDRLTEVLIEKEIKSLEKKLEKK